MYWNFRVIVEAAITHSKNHNIRCIEMEKRSLQLYIGLQKNHNVRCIEILPQIHAQGSYAMKNHNIRCIEMLSRTQVYKEKLKKNHNIRCIEILLVQFLCLTQYWRTITLDVLKSKYRNYFEPYKNRRTITL